MKWVVFDIDGVLADPTHRLPYIMRPEPDWDTFFSLVAQDTPRMREIEILRVLSNHVGIALLTGRSDQCMQPTVDWLRAHKVPWASIWMREKGDHRPDYIIKPELLRKFQASQEIGDDDILAIFEDRSGVVQSWRNMGFLAFQNAEGNF